MRKTKPVDGTLAVHNKIPISEACARISKHRSCWKHMILSLHTQGKQIKRQEAEELWSFELRYPCFLDTFLARERSKRRLKHKNTIAKLIKEKKEKKKLNSGKFDCYFQTLWRSFSEDKRTWFTYLDSMWFALYMKPPFKGKVLSWIKRKQIFSKNYVLVPIVCWNHWSLLILCHLGESVKSEARKPCMLLLDSLEIANPRRLEPDIRKFVLDIYKSEGRAENKKLSYQIPLLVPKVPQQRDGVECGNYVLYFIHSFVQMAPKNFSMKEYPYFMDQTWFSPECLERLFEELKPSGE